MNFGVGDLVSIGTAVIFVLFGVLKPVNRTAERASCSSSQTDCRSVLLSPLFQLAGVKANLLDIAVKEEKLTLWWAAAVAAVNIIRTLL